MSSLIRKHIIRKNIALIEISDKSNIGSDYRYLKLVILLMISIIDYCMALVLRQPVLTLTFFAVLDILWDRHLLVLVRRPHRPPDAEKVSL